MKRKCRECGETFIFNDDYDVSMINPKDLEICEPCFRHEEDMRNEGERAIDDFSDADPGL